MEKRFFSHYDRIENGGNGGVISYRCPNSLDYIISEVIIRENADLALLGGADININIVSSAYRVSRRILSSFITHILPTNYIINQNMTKSFISSRKTDSENIDIIVNGGDTIEIEVNTKGFAGSVVDVLIVGQLVGEW